MTIISAYTTDHYDAAEKLFNQYQQFLGVDLCFQGFQDELRQLPQMYGLPNGALLLAMDGDQYIGCVAVRKKDSDTCEMKRLYVKEEYKGKGVGKKLAEAIIVKGRELDCHKMILDTLERLQPALKLYCQLGFTEIPAYYHNPLEAVVYMAKEL